jgi:hypothetical protein
MAVSTPRQRTRDYARNEDLLGLGDRISVNEALVQIQAYQDITGRECEGLGIDENRQHHGKKSGKLHGDEMAELVTLYDQISKLWRRQHII